MLKKITIIIVSCNSEHHIFDCIASIYKYNDIGDALELIVVDNNSKHVDDMFSSIEKQFGKDIILISNKTNGGYGQGNNIGIRKASGSIILIMNPDVRLVQPIFIKALAHFEKSKVVMLGMVQMVSSDKRGLSFISKFSKYPIWEILETVLGNKLLHYNQKSMFFSGACFFIRKNTFEEIGLFDEEIFLYGEENDIHD
ncbi:MAG: glycosyltransferase, partial [Pigmentiphaga sp.]|nr:glycosyltransferase [Pigmentiphaga sp.]